MGEEKLTEQLRQKVLGSVRQLVYDTSLMVLVEGKVASQKIVGEGNFLHAILVGWR